MFGAGSGHLAIHRLADAISGVAAVLLVVTTLRWSHARNLGDLIFAGFARGIAISTKFTFCPMLVMWPAAIFAFRCFYWTGWRREAVHVLGGLFLQCVIAGGVVVLSYGATQVGVGIDDHASRSERLRWLNLLQHQGLTSQRSALSRMPSPFQKQFVVGIDEQQRDIEKGYPT
ncbi:hypothetical protein [Planctomycetes bacterium K23_9]|uniref:Glycosyltransferase RgtA/B/C/D-like domain-containing protein n=1 Tax=Stieleria marina TaxID=1930275 RepID=A0A517NXY2_9BACT|nr:hypothetical protein K239x_39960 [Planctomycetes bacterium K23_9]